MATLVAATAVIAPPAPAAPYDQQIATGEAITTATAKPTRIQTPQVAQFTIYGDGDTSFTLNASQSLTSAVPCARLHGYVLLDGDRKDLDMRVTSPRGDVVLVDEFTQSRGDFDLVMDAPGPYLVRLAGHKSLGPSFAVQHIVFVEESATPCG